MIITIEKAIIHTAQCTTGILTCSEQELDISKAVINAYISSHIEKLFGHHTVVRGMFRKNSRLMHQLSVKPNDFINVSKSIAENAYEAFSTIEKPKDYALLICEAIISDEPYFVILKLDNKVGYLCRTNGTDNFVNTFVNSPSLLPQPSQIIKEFAFINLNDVEHVRYAGSIHKLDGLRINVFEDCILEADCEQISSKEAYNGISKSLASTTNEPLEIIVRLKEFIRDTVNTHNSRPDVAEETTFTLNEVAEAILDAPSIRSEFIEQCKDSFGIAADEGDKFIVDDYIQKKTNDKITIVTDTGIEIKFPAELYRNPEKLDIEYDDAGYQTVAIKGIQFITVKN